MKVWRPAGSRNAAAGHASAQAPDRWRSPASSLRHVSNPFSLDENTLQTGVNYAMAD
jgi:hypothetical protein